MQYIVLDMEWNQPWPGSYAAQKVLPVQIHGEIIQIGAVRLLETGKIADEFQVLVRPKYYKKLNSRVSKLTGLRDARLREEGLSFPEALERFRDWIGGPCIFLTWGAGGQYPAARRRAGLDHAVVQCADDLQCADRLWQHSEGPLDRHGAARHRAVAPGARRAR